MSIFDFTNLYKSRNACQVLAQGGAQLLEDFLAPPVSGLPPCDEGGRLGAWRPTRPGEVFEKGREFRVDQSARRTFVCEAHEASESAPPASSSK